MKNQGENKNRNKFNSYTFIHFLADLIRPLYIFCILMSNIYIYVYIYIYIYIYNIYIIYIYNIYIYIYLCVYVRVCGLVRVCVLWILYIQDVAQKV